MKLAGIICLLLAPACGFAAAPPALVVPHGQLGQAGNGVPPNLLLNLSLTFEDAGAAYRESYAAGAVYPGYFNSRLCYVYPAKVKGRVQEPDLDARSGYFSPLKAADARFECGADSFSGNFLNWATMSTLDLLRYGLTGGDRVIDEQGLTVLQRAWLPDGAANPDFYAHPEYFPRKSLSGEDAGRLTPFPGETLYITSCRNRVMFSNSQKGKNCDAPRFGANGRRLVSDKYLGEFNVRVSVCTADDSARRPDLCRAYGTDFKPEGAIQMGAKGLRVGIMSYLTESGAGDPFAYGGALRAALGPVAGEFDPVTGIAGSSGAIAFINRLGRSNPKRLGAYTSSDPGAELFYEALRYLQGRGPSVAGGGASDDGLPVLNTRSDPVLAACQRNVIATIGHPAFVGDRFVPGNTRTLFGDGARDGDDFAAARFDVMAAARKVGEMEADLAGAFGNPSPRPDLLKLDTLDDGPAGSGSRYLAGAAYWAHLNPIRKDKPVTVDSFSLELGTAASARSSALYLAAKYGAFDDRNGDGNPFITSGARRDSSEWSSDGATPAWFFSGARPQSIVNAVRAMFGEARGQREPGPGPSAAWQGQGAAFVIVTSANPATGSGTVQRRALTVRLGGAATVAGEPAWDAAELLDGNPRKSPPIPTAATQARPIFTYPGHGRATLPFEWTRLPADLRALLDVPAPGAAPDGRGKLRLDFLRGERSLEIGGPEGVFRKRSSILGDSVHATPLIVGPPAAQSNGRDYDAFREQYKSRPMAVYVGANDGMLHAFAATDGAELFAFIPRALFASLPELASPSYEPRPWVDGAPAQGDALIGGKWRTVLASSMGMGARGVFALDISNPSAFDKGLGALWEFTGKDDPAMGHVRAAPLFARLRTGQGTKAAPRHVAVVASGINNLAADGSGALFLLMLDKPAAQAWQRGVNYFSIATPATGSALPNALAAPALVAAGDASALYAYAGDLQGNLWRFNLRTMAAHRLFTARNSAGAVQPITHAPKVVFAPGGGYLVTFGTGKFIEHADTLRASFTPQSMYAIHDKMLDTPVPVDSRDQLARRTLSGGGKEGYTVKGDPVDYFAPDAKRGWYFDFPNARNDGERAGGSPSSVAGAIVFETLLPAIGPCSSPASRLYVIDAASGLALDADGMVKPDAVTGEQALPASSMPPLLIDAGARSGARNPTGGAMATRFLAFLKPGTKGARAKKVAVSFPARRLGWREVANWQELHDAASQK